MKSNVGGIDRIVRFVVGAGLVAWAISGGPVWAWIGVIPLATAALGLCPLYSVLGFSTCTLRK